MGAVPSGGASHRAPISPQRWRVGHVDELIIIMARGHPRHRPQLSDGFSEDIDLERQAFRQSCYATRVQHGERPVAELERDLLGGQVRQSSSRAPA